ncbi:P-loop containing nucleoside triphosphate hydrolase protein [Xylaria sp. CBS 124048]|nr:P-loop containing nucleoside triphosphate hydrolase protein [Xylaria sp. CBS 124048]
MPLLPPTTRWLLLSDIHFRLRDIDRTRRTAEWIVSVVRQTPNISRVVVCGDVLTSRSMQPTAVIAAAYHFLSDLSNVVPHVHMILGNHDLAYRRDYTVTALEALKMTRLRPFVSLHDEVSQYNWDGRDVLVLPFREDQSELTNAVANLGTAEAANTVAFAHLAINRAVMQRHVIRDDSGELGYPIRYKGLTGPDYFKSLARTFTGHFHSHQTILQPNQHAPPPPEGSEDLNGSLTYIGAPLQLTWADLCDENRGVILLNPATLEHELIVNPHAVGYITVQGSEVLADKIDASTVQNKHIMILGKHSQFQYWTARDKLLSLGAQSVREPRPTTIKRDGSQTFLSNALGASMPASDREAVLQFSEPSDLSAETSELAADDEQKAASESDDLQSAEIDPVEYVRDYVRASEVGSVDEEQAIQLGQRLILASESTASLDDEISYKALLDSNHAITNQKDLWAPSKKVFVAKLRSIVMTNFLGIREECTIDLDDNRGRGLTFVVGSNGAGKSTLIEAIVWCQFGRCIRKGLSVGDVVNDVAGKDCMVSLSFSNGYTITRYRKHKIQGNRVIVSLHGIEQPQFEHGEARATQLALDELLGIDYEEFIKTVVLGHESAAGFLSSTPAQRQDLIESTLRLSRLDKSANLSRRMLREVDDDVVNLQSQITTVEQTISITQDRIADRNSELQRSRREEEKLRETINVMSAPQVQEITRTSDEELSALDERLEILELKIQEMQEAVNQTQSIVKEIEIWEDVAAQQLAVDQSIQAAKSQCEMLQNELQRLRRVRFYPVKMDHIDTFELKLRGLAQTISWLQLHLSNAADYLSPLNRMMLHFIRIGLASLGRLSSDLDSLLDQLKVSVSKQAKKQVDTIESQIERLENQLTERESSIIRLGEDKEEVHAQVALRRDLSEDSVRMVFEKFSSFSVQDVQDVKRLLALSLKQLSKLLEEQGTLHRQQAKAHRDNATLGDDERKRLLVQSQAKIEALERLAKLEQSIEIYKKLIEEETSILDEQRSRCAALQVEMESLASTRELFAFWEESLSRRRTKMSTASTFRGFVLDKSLQELNHVAARILLVLYENTRHARELTNGMLRSIIAPDSESEQDSETPQTTVLDQTLGVNKTLSYAKRSGGERKRIDLAVFFALVQIAQANSTHRARYILVDEAFDSLDEAGQTAVVRWCSQLMTWADFQLVVTHSEYLAKSARGQSDSEDSDDSENRFAILSAKMTQEGTKFSYATE